MTAVSRPGDKLPTQEALSRQYGVNRSTIVRALANLLAEGCVKSRQGSGIYIAEKRETREPLRFISLIVPRLHAHVMVQACRGVEERARQLGYRVMLASSDFDLQQEKELVEQHIHAGTKGIVLYPVTRRSKDIETDYLTHWSGEVPVVALDIGHDSWRCSLVKFDNFRLGYDMTEHLVRHGHRNIAFTNWPSAFLHNSVHERREGWLAAMTDFGAPIPETYRRWPLHSHEDGNALPEALNDYEEIADRFLDLSPRPDAVIESDDVPAAHLIQALINRGLTVPYEIRVVGFDNDRHVTRLFRPLFPTSKPDFVRLGQLGMDVLDGMVSAGSSQPRSYFLPVPVLWREPVLSSTSSRTDRKGGEIAIER